MEDLLINNENSLNSLKDEDSFIAAKNWDRLVDTAYKMGYREGISDGKDTAFQKGFDIGYEEAFNNAFRLGKCKSLATILSQDSAHSNSIHTVLDQTKEDLCFICKESKDIQINTAIKDSFLDVKNNQRMYVTDTVNVLCEHLKEILIKSDIDISKIKL